MSQNFPPHSSIFGLHKEPNKTPIPPYNYSLTSQLPTISNELTESNTIPSLPTFSTDSSKITTKNNRSEKSRKRQKRQSNLTDIDILLQDEQQALLQRLPSTKQEQILKLPPLQQKLVLRNLQIQQQNGNDIYFNDNTHQNLVNDTSFRSSPTSQSTSMSKSTISPYNNPISGIPNISNTIPDIKHNNSHTNSIVSLGSMVPSMSNTVNDHSVDSIFSLNNKSLLNNNFSLTDTSLEDTFHLQTTVPSLTSSNSPPSQEVSPGLTDLSPISQHLSQTPPHRLSHSLSPRVSFSDPSLSLNRARSNSYSHNLNTSKISNQNSIFNDYHSPISSSNPLSSTHLSKINSLSPLTSDSLVNQLSHPNHHSNLFNIDDNNDMNSKNNSTNLENKPMSSLETLNSTFSAYNSHSEHPINHTFNIDDSSNLHQTNTSSNIFPDVLMNVHSDINNHLYSDHLNSTNHNSSFFPPSFSPLDPYSNSHISMNMPNQLNYDTDTIGSDYIPSNNLSSSYDNVDINNYFSIDTTFKTDFSNSNNYNDYSYDIQPSTNVSNVKSPKKGKKTEKTPKAKTTKTTKSVKKSKPTKNDTYNSANIYNMSTDYMYMDPSLFVTNDGYDHNMINSDLETTYDNYGSMPNSLTPTTTTSTSKRKRHTPLHKYDFDMIPAAQVTPKSKKSKTEKPKIESATPSMLDPTHYSEHISYMMHMDKNDIMAITEQAWDVCLKKFKKTLKTMEVNPETSVAFQKEFFRLIQKHQAKQK